MTKWNPRPFSELKNTHPGKDIWLIASGKSLDYIDPAFFENKITLGMNYAYRRFRTTYALARDHTHFELVYQNAPWAIMLAATEGSHGANPHNRLANIPHGPNGRTVYQFESKWYGRTGLNLGVIGSENELAGGMGSILCAMHACAYLGAANIILCGADGGMLDGEKYSKGYRAEAEHKEPPALESNDKFVDWLGMVEAQMAAVRERLHEVYGCRVVSLNPFLNFGLEGHCYEHA